jgi:hypothetical protein
MDRYPQSPGLQVLIKGKPIYLSIKEHQVILSLALSMTLNFILFGIQMAIHDIQQPLMGCTGCGLEEICPGVYSPPQSRIS